MAEMLVLPNVLTCDRCGTDFEHFFRFPERVETAQDITDDDLEIEVATCPQCGQTVEVEWQGWSSHDAAG